MSGSTGVAGRKVGTMPNLVSVEDAVYICTRSESNGSDLQIFDCNDVGVEQTREVMGELQGKGYKVQRIDDVRGRFIVVTWT